jgi:hypothetical protein
VSELYTYQNARCNNEKRVTILLDVSLIVPISALWNERTWQSCRIFFFGRVYFEVPKSVAVHQPKINLFYYSTPSAMKSIKILAKLYECLLFSVMLRCYCWLFLTYVCDKNNILSYVWGNTRCRGWSRHYATSLKVAGSIPDEVIGIFNWR